MSSPMNESADFEAHNFITEFAQNGNQYVTFTLDQEEYGLPILKVQEIIGYRKLTKIPNVPSFITGILNLRGTIVPAIDLRVKFGMSEKKYDLFTIIIIVNAGERTLGLIADSVSDVLTFADSDIQKTPKVSAKIKTEFIKGIGQTNNKFVILLDIEKMVSEYRLDALNTEVH